MHNHDTFTICIHYLWLIGRVYVFYVGHVDKSSLYETLFHCNILIKHHHPSDPPVLIKAGLKDIKEI
jgi:hypothetical protein